MEIMQGMHWKLIELPFLLSILGRITILLAGGWVAHLLLMGRNPRWRVLTWRIAAVGVLAVPLSMAVLPGISLRMAFLKGNASRLLSSTIQSMEIPGNTPNSEAALQRPQSEIGSSDSVGSTGSFAAIRTPIRMPIMMTDEGLGIAADTTPGHFSAQNAMGMPESGTRWSKDSLVLFALWLWVTVILALAIRLLLSYFKMRRILADTVPASDELADLSVRIAAELGCQATPEVRMSASISSPLIAGIRKPLLLLPLRICEENYEHHYPAIFVHEICHIRGRDIIWAQVIEWASILFWFHPLIWGIRTAHSAACEQTCDGVAALYVGDPRDYSRTLARVVVDMLPSSNALPGIPMARVSDITRRLDLLKRRVFADPLAKSGLALFIALAACLVALISCSRIAPPQEPGIRFSLSEAKEILLNSDLRDVVIPTREGAWHCSPALADMDNDGDLEIIANGGIWHHDGRSLPGWSQAKPWGSHSPAVGDVDGDGKLEVAGAGNLWRSDGTLMPGWPAGARPNGFCTPSLCDVDGDGDLEVLSTDMELGICVWQHDGTMLRGWPIRLGNNDNRCTPQAHDIDGDGKKEIIFVDGDEQKIHVRRLDGSSLAVWAVPNAWVLEQPFVLADMNGDGTIEMIYQGKAVDLTDGKVLDVEGAGTGIAACLIPDPPSGRLQAAPPALPAEHLPFAADISAHPGSYSDSAVSADIDGDGQLEVLFGNREGGFHAYRIDGTQAAGWPKRLAPAGDCGMGVADLDGNGFLDVVANTGGARIYVFDSAGSAEGRSPWPVFLANNQRTGVSGKAPRAKGASEARAQEQVAQLRKALAAGDWDSAIAIYRGAMAAIERRGRKLERKELGLLLQNAHLSVARILNTRARRFEEAAKAYRQAVEIAPDTWQAYQALTECWDLAALNARMEAAKGELAGILGIIEPALGLLVSPERREFYLAAIKAANLVGDSERVARLLAALENPAAPAALSGQAGSPATSLQTKKAPAEFESDPSIRRMADSLRVYGGAPFLLSFDESWMSEHWTNADSLRPEIPVQARTEYELLVSPNSPNQEPFPMKLTVRVSPMSGFLLDEGWVKNGNGMLEEVIEKEQDSSEYATFRVNHVKLCSKSETFVPPRLERKIALVSDNRMKARFFLQSPGSHLFFSMTVPRDKASILSESVIPQHGFFLMHPTELRFETSGRCNCGCDKEVLDQLDLASGVWFEMTMELQPGVKPFYPAYDVIVQDDRDRTFQAGQSPMRSISGSFEGINYEIASERPFRMHRGQIRNWKRIGMRNRDVATTETVPFEMASPGTSNDTKTSQSTAQAPPVALAPAPASSSQSQAEPISANPRIRTIVEKLCKEAEKAYADAGVKKEEVDRAMQQDGKAALIRERVWPRLREIQTTATAALASLGFEAIPDLLKARDPSIGRIGGDIFISAVAAMGESAVPPLLELLKQPDHALRVRAIEILERMGSPKAAEPLAGLLQDQNPRIVQMSIRAMAACANENTFPALRSFWNTPRCTEEMKPSVARTLGMLGDPRAFDILAKELKQRIGRGGGDGEKNLRQDPFYRALVQLRDGRIVPVLVDELERMKKSFTPDKQSIMDLERDLNMLKTAPRRSPVWSDPLSVFPGSEISAQRAQSILDKINRAFEQNFYRPADQLRSLRCEFVPVFRDNTDRFLEINRRAAESGQESPVFNLDKGLRVGMFDGLDQFFLLRDNRLSEAKKAVFFFQQSGGSPSLSPQGHYRATLVFYDAHDRMIPLHPFARAAMGDICLEHLRLSGQGLRPPAFFAPREHMTIKWKLDAPRSDENVLTQIVEHHMQGNGRERSMQALRVRMYLNGLPISTESLRWDSGTREWQPTNDSIAYATLGETGKIAPVKSGSIFRSMEYEWQKAGDLWMVSKVRGSRIDMAPGGERRQTPWEIAFSRFEINPEIPPDVLQWPAAKDIPVDLSKPEDTANTLLLCLRLGRMDLLPYITTKPPEQPVPREYAGDPFAYYFDAFENMARDLKVVEISPVQEGTCMAKIQIPMPLSIRARQFDIPLKLVGKEWRWDGNISEFHRRLFD